MLTPKPPIGAMPRAVSSRKRHRSTIPPPDPPNSSGIATPSQPSSATLAYSSGIVRMAPVRGQRVALLARAALALAEVADRVDEVLLLLGHDAGL